MKKIGIVLFILIFLTSTLLGCGKQDVNIDLETIDVSEIKKIECIGTTGGIDGDYSYSFSDNEVVEFVDLLNQVKLGDKVDENKALSNGAVAYYTIYFATDKTLTMILSILVYTFFSRMFDLMLPPVAKHSIVVA